MMRSSDPRMAISGAYRDMEKYGAHHLIPEFEEKLNNVDGPGNWRGRNDLDDEVG